MNSTFIEIDCVVEFEGEVFESGGSWLSDCTDGYRRGVVYAKPHHDFAGKVIDGAHGGSVTDWHGRQLATASFGRVYVGSFGAKMRSVSFTVNGVRFSGRYGCDWADAVRVKSTKKV